MAIVVTYGQQWSRSYVYLGGSDELADKENGAAGSSFVTCTAGVVYVVYVTDMVNCKMLIQSLLSVSEWRLDHECANARAVNGRRYERDVGGSKHPALGSTLISHQVNSEPASTPFFIRRMTSG